MATTKGQSCFGVELYPHLEPNGPLQLLTGLAIGQLPVVIGSPSNQLVLAHLPECIELGFVKVVGQKSKLIFFCLAFVKGQFGGCFLER